MNKFLAAALLAGVATSAMAADLPNRTTTPAPPPVYAPPPFTWTGFYIGVNGGYGWGSVSSSNFGGISGGLFGGQVGYNYQVGQFVGGVEGDLDWSGLSSGGHGYALGSNKLTTNTMVTDRLRAGVALDRALLYVTGGYAGVDTRGSFFDTVNGIGGAQSNWRNGGVIGAGLEYAFTNNITAKAEYLYMPMGSTTYFAGTRDAENSGLNISLVRAGLNYKF